MKAVLMSVNPTWCKETIELRKLVEVRKTAPKLERPFKVYIYCTQGRVKETLNLPITTARMLADMAVNGMKSMNCEIGNGKVIAEYNCDWVFEILPEGDGYDITEDNLARTRLTTEQLREYGQGSTLYGWEISGLKIYDRPRELEAFGLARPPQSWCYVEEAVAHG